MASTINPYRILALRRTLLCRASTSSAVLAASTGRLISKSRSFSTSASRASPPAKEETPAAGEVAAPLSSSASSPLSSCPAGTVLTGLNYMVGKTDPVAQPDEAYPAWLWTCLDTYNKVDTSEDPDAGDEFSKSKKLRRKAAKRLRELEARAAESGDLEALAPKIPLQHQTINLAVGAGGPEDLEGNLLAAAKRRELRIALRHERRAKIKENNYLQSM